MSESWQEFAKRQSDYAVELERQLRTAERERDEARRERDEFCTDWERAMAYWNKCGERIGQLEREREAMRAVVEAVRGYFNGEPTDDALYAAWCEYSRATSSVRALDAAEADHP